MIMKKGNQVEIIYGKDKGKKKKKKAPVRRAIADAGTSRVDVVDSRR